MAMLGSLGSLMQRCLVGPVGVGLPMLYTTTYTLSGEIVQVRSLVSAGLMCWSQPQQALQGSSYVATVNTRQEPRDHNDMLLYWPHNHPNLKTGLSM